ncbi:Crp/FNR family transcriptional regulator [Catenovulum agarivorans DS-2]|uniref:Cytochrome c-551 n=1 Tax=Catenovulum agarivorans DS-2 TaxID=1328313 RepID=W7QIJ5_9ALTE|nr:ThuA domain-containing protein [Catenovulum agarivorans]EWH11671.1 Crp/FNR family transcriptional regulator [Catenovulum agarivorans DS-2]
MKFIKTKTIFFILTVGLLTACSQDSKKTPAEKTITNQLDTILIYSKTTGWRHDSIETGVATVSKLAKDKGLKVIATEDASVFNDEQLAKMAAVVFVNTTGDVLDDDGQLAFERYIQAGGGFVGIHSATDTEHKGDWYWYRRMIGGVFLSHPDDPSNVQQARIKVVNDAHPATQNLPAEFLIADEWYDFKDLSDRRKDLLVLDESSYQQGKQGFYHPLAWYHEFDGGRVFYTGIGHTKAVYQHPLYLEHLSGGLDYALAQRKPLDYSKAKPDMRRFEQKVVTDNLVEPVSFSLSPDLTTALITQRRGKLLWVDIESGERHIMVELDLFAKEHKRSEFGFLSAIFDPKFEQNQLVYLMYDLVDASKQHDLIQRISQVKVVDKKLDMASEQVLLDIPMDDTCCHTGGNLEFDRHGNLFITIGDNTNPFESNGTGPISNVADRAHHDALRTSANTQDLRGKILRITPNKQGGYTIPQGNLFADSSKGRAEIYVMGTRNPYTMAVDPQSDTIYFADIGPDARKDSDEFGPRGYCEINKVTEPGNFGWPTMIANNLPYRMYDYAQKKTGKLFNPLAPQNFSPRNTGLTELPQAQPAVLYYPYAPSAEFPELGQGGRNSLVAGIYPSGDGYAYPKYFERKLFIGDFMRHWLKVVTLDKFDRVVKIDNFAEHVEFAGLLDMQIDAKGRLWVLEYGVKWWPEESPEAKLSFFDFNHAPIEQIIAKLSVGKEQEVEPQSDKVVDHQTQVAISEGKDAAKENRCIGCHQEKQTSVGPSFMQVANKYSQVEEGKNKIAEVIAKGSSGQWGEHQMPPHDFLPQDTRELIAEYILSLAE